MSYLPPGWTESRLSVATVDDLRGVPEDRLHELDVDVIENMNAQTIVRRARRYENYRLDREKKGLPPAPRKPIFKDEPSVDPVVQMVERTVPTGGNFGFLLFRNDFSSEERWKRWQEGYNRIIDATWPKVSGGNKVKDQFLTRLVDSEDNDASMGQIAEAFHSYLENGNVPPGLDCGMCLAVETDAMDSLLDPVPGQEPWVYAIDTSFDFEHPDDENMDGYPGFFKVAIEALVPELYPFIAGAQMDPRELWQPRKPIWKHAIEL